MKYFIALTAGIVLGAAAAAAVLYYNPLNASTTSAAAAGREAWTLRYRFPAESTIALTHDDRRRLPYLPQGIAHLWEETLSGVMLNALVLEDDTGTPQALASRISVPSAETDLLLRGVIVADYWLVTAPGRGSLFIEADNNLWPLLKDTLPVAYLKREWPGAASYPITAGPARAGALVVGATGEWAKVEGAARESYAVERYSAAAGLEAMEGELVLELAERETEALPGNAAAEIAQP